MSDPVEPMMTDNLFTAAQTCLAATDVDAKAELTHAMAARWRAGELSLQEQAPPQPIGEPGRPQRPQLVVAKAVPKRGLGTVEGRAALIHALAHIEFNAINLAWDAVYRFRGLPREFYADWIRVADEEAYHFRLLRRRLRKLEYDYGDFPAHNGLWEMARKTAFDVMVRMALVPRVLEARGLDVTPGIMQRLVQAGDQETVAILEIILRDEIGHVEIGSRWFKYLCAQRGLDAQATFRQLIRDYFSGELRGPFHHAARRQAGFSDEEMAALERLGAENARLSGR